MHVKLARALKESGDLYALSDILEAIEDGRMQSFAHRDSWIVTQINKFPQKKVVSVVIGVGEMDDIFWLENQITKFARDIGADCIIMNGRPGWLKFQELFEEWEQIGSRYRRNLKEQ